MDRPLSFKDAFWGGDFTSSAGFDALKKRIKDGRNICKAYAEYLQKRAKSEEEFAKLLSSSAKSAPKITEAGSTLRIALDCMKEETDRLVEVHVELCGQFNLACKRVNDFMARQRTENKQREETVDRALKTKVNLFRACNEAKKLYEAKSLEADNAENALSIAKTRQNQYQTKDWDKLVTSANKTKNEAEKAHANYEECVRKLESARYEWEHEMEEFCKLCEEHEVQRIKMLQNEAWVGCNVNSIGANKLDEHSEAVRKKLECVNITGDVQSFVLACATGSERPAPVRFEPFKSKMAGANGMVQFDSTLPRTDATSRSNNAPVQVLNRSYR